ncbi:MAG TPA: protein kinase [Pyrinomonadaceae bacterium]|nr:protein kinase [Pyrinomonadaceae bacterium]
MLDRYQVIKRLGEGAFSEDFLASDTELERQVAIKIERDKTAQLPTTLGLSNEGRIVANFAHPNIITVFDVGRKDDRTYLVSEFIEGSLEEVLKQSTVLPREKVVDLIIKVADALDYVHRRGFLHRNIKPRVILMDGSGEPRLSGFQIAIRQADLPADGSVAGTLSYMAPEQFDGNHGTMGAHTDIWGLGVTFYEALTKKLPFPASGVAGLARQVFYEDPAPPAEVDSSIPSELIRICLKCLSKEIANRYSTASEVANDLRVWQRGTTPQPQHRVFVSHSSQDREYVEREIVPILETHGIKTWYSKASIQTAAEWERSIREGLESCEWFLLVMSPRASESEWVRDEVFWAVDKRPQNIIPVVIDDCDPREFHIRLARVQHVDFRFDLETARQQLLQVFTKG